MLDGGRNRPVTTEWIQRMAHIEKRSDRRKPWRVRYRDPTGRERSRSFARKVDADRFMATVQADLIRGDWTDPRLSQVTVDEWAERWFHTKSHLKPKTLAGYRSNLHAHVLPTFGRYQLRHVDRMAVEEWVADLQASGLGPSGIRQARQVLNSMLTLAVDAGYLAANPVESVRTPRQPEPQMLFLDADQVERLAKTIQEPYGTLIYLLAYGGLRWGEAAALRRGCCDLRRCRIDIREAVSEAGGELHYGATKNHRSRIIGVPGFLVTSSTSTSYDTSVTIRRPSCSPHPKAHRCATATSDARSGTRPSSEPDSPKVSGSTTYATPAPASSSPPAPTPKPSKSTSGTRPSR